MNSRRSGSASAICGSPATSYGVDGRSGQLGPSPVRSRARMEPSGTPSGPPPGPEPVPRGYHEAVRAFKKKFLYEMLAEHGGNRTHTARTLGLQRTYLLRLIRELGLDMPPPRRSTARCATVSRSSTSP